MGDVAITHAETGAIVNVPESAVPQYRQSGWTTVEEAQELRDHLAKAAKADTHADAAKESASRPAAAKKAAGGGD